MRAALAVMVLVLLAGAAQAGEDPAQAEKIRKADLQRLLATYEANRRNNGDEANKIKRGCLEAIGDMKDPSAVSFLASVVREEKTPMLMVASLVALGKVGTLQAVQAAFQPALNPGADDLHRDALPWGMRFCRDEKAAAWVAKTVLRSGDVRVRLSAVESLGLMECRSAVPGLVKALKDRDLTVVYEAIRALGRIGDGSALGALGEFPASKDWRLREAAAFALGSFEDETCLTTLLGLLKDESWQVRESAVFSLRRAGNKEATESLIEALEDGNRRVATEIREALKEFSGKDFGYDRDLWRSWWRAKGREAGDAPPKPELTAASYHGIKVESDRALFIIDTSGSMDWGDRITKARDELSRVLHQLDAKTQFNIMTFSDSPLTFEKEMVPALPVNVDRADAWISKQRPFSGTNTFDTLQKAFEEIKGLDTVYFLSDGIPTRGKYLAQEKILAELNKLNRFLKIRVHTIALLVGDSPPGVDEDKEGAERFMKRLAEENQGQSVVVK